MASVAGGPVPFSQLFVPGGVQQTTPFVGGLQQVMPFLPVGGPMQSNSYVFGASMSPGGFAVPMSPAFGDARGGLVAGNDPVVTEVGPGSACAGIVQEPPETVEEINVDVPPERREDGLRTPRKRQAEQEVFIGTPEPRSSRVRQVHAPSEVQGMPSMPSMPVGMRGSSSVPVGSPLINAPWISTQGGTTFGVTPEVWRQMQQQSMPQQPVRPQPDPLMMFMQQQSQQNALMMQQMMQMTTAVVQALNGLSAGAPPGGGKGGVSSASGGGPPAGASFGGVSSSGHGGGGSSTSFPAEGKMPFNVNLPACAWRESGTHGTRSLWVLGSGWISFRIG